MFLENRLAKFWFTGLYSMCYFNTINTAIMCIITAIIVFYLL